jgi:predicted nucleic acid-binding protein
LSIDLKSTLRRRKPAKRTSQLVPRPREALVDLTALPSGPLFLLLDTNVYINRAAGRLAPHVRDGVDQALLFHCSVALAELALGVANADPSRAGWTAMQDHYAELFASIPASRLVTPDAQIWTDAGVIAGTLTRTQGFQPHQRKECLNDALIFLTAAKAGIPVLTANRDEFDLIQQLAPEGQFIHC